MKNNNIGKIFLITIDALRADHVSCICGGKLTPNIDDLTKKAYYFREPSQMALLLLNPFPRSLLNEMSLYLYF